jgi:hypothetical protein
MKKEVNNLTKFYMLFTMLIQHMPAEDKAGIAIIKEISVVIDSLEISEKK